jgi:selenocysteine lyase/cysteine desulfurase
MTYADYTASGRCLSFVEDYLRTVVMPMYGNTHTEASHAGLETSRHVENARRTIMKSLNGSEMEDAVIFTGSGSTSAIAKLIDCLEIRLPHGLNTKYSLLEKIPAAQRPVVFVGPMEHHSNELMWRETIADVVVIDEDEYGFPDLGKLKEQLEIFSERPLKIGTFSAGSNVTGILPPQVALTNMLHAHKALSCWDFAGAGPYVTVDLNPVGCDQGIDAIFLSPHKYPGGPGTPGILAAKKSLFTNAVPIMPGGGTVVFVDKQNQWYVDDISHREEGGTPGILQIVKAGLVFTVKDAVGSKRIEQLEEGLAARAIASWSLNPKIILIGDGRKGYHAAHRMTIFSFNIKFRDTLLSPHFVIALLNDLYGIQARSGCSCAGPYGHRLLSFSDEISKEMCDISLAGEESVKTGWARLNL